MRLITPEGKKIPPGFRTKYRVITTDSSGNVVNVSRIYRTEASAIRRAEKEDNSNEVPSLSATLFECLDSE